MLRVEITESLSNAKVDEVLRKLNLQSVPRVPLEAIEAENEVKSTELIAEVKLQYDIGILFKAIQTQSYKMVKWCFEQKNSFNVGQVIYASVVIAIQAQPKEGYIEIIKFLVLKLKPNDIDDELILLAVATGNIKIIRLILARGQSVYQLSKRTLDSKFSTDIIGSAVYQKNIELLEYLFENEVKLQKGDGTSCYLAISFKRVDIFKVLIRNGLDLENSDVATVCLNGAFENNDAEMVKVMFSNGLKPTFSNMKYGVYAGTPDCMDVFLDYSLDVSGLPFMNYLQGLLDYAENSEKHMLLWIASRKVFHDTFLFSFLAGAAELEAIKAMLKVSPEFKLDLSTQAVSVIAVVKSAISFVSDQPKNELEVLDFLLDLGAPIYSYDCSAFFASVNGGRVDFVESFFKHGLSTNLLTDESILSEQFENMGISQRDATLENFPSFRDVAIAIAKYRNNIPMMQFLETQWAQSYFPSSSGAVRQHQIDKSDINIPRHVYTKKDGSQDTFYNLGFGGVSRTRVANPKNKPTDTSI